MTDPDPEFGDLDPEVERYLRERMAEVEQFVATVHRGLCLEVERHRATLPADERPDAARGALLLAALRLTAGLMDHAIALDGEPARLYAMEQLVKIMLALHAGASRGVTH